MAVLCVGVDGVGAKRRPLIDWRLGACGMAEKEPNKAEDKPSYVSWQER